jgi:hypothetical protein
MIFAIVLQLGRKGKVQRTIPDSHMEQIFDYKKIEKEGQKSEKGGGKEGEEGKERRTR